MPTLRRPCAAPLALTAHVELCAEHADCMAMVTSNHTEIERHDGHAPGDDCTDACAIVEHDIVSVSHSSRAAHGASYAHHACRMGEWRLEDGTVVHLEDRTVDPPAVVVNAPMCADCHDAFHGPDSHPGAAELLDACQGCKDHVAACPSRPCRSLLGGRPT